MQDRLADLGAARQRATISTIHGFCLEMLADRGKPVGVNGQPQIFERASDRRQILLEAVNGDLELKNALTDAGDSKAQSQRLDAWLRAIGQIKAYPMSRAVIEDAFEERLLDAYNASLRASNAYDFDDLLILAYQLLIEYPFVADFYRRLYGYICIDEAQDLNEAQYAVYRLYAVLPFEMSC
jgi:DNA helicase-2/ATP-dependent DNA helicase PcrA